MMEMEMKPWETRVLMPACLFVAYEEEKERLPWTGAAKGGLFLGMELY